MQSATLTCIVIKSITEAPPKPVSCALTCHICTIHFSSRRPVGVVPCAATTPVPDPRTLDLALFTIILLVLSATSTTYQQSCSFRSFQLCSWAGHHSYIAVSQSHTRRWFPAADSESQHPPKIVSLLSCWCPTESQMSQSRSRSKRQDPPARDMKPYWVERGYRPEVAALQPRPNEDPKGEVAYQRAFAEAAKSDPPRLPNPQKYPNSESAMAFLRQRDIEFTTARGSKRFGDEPPNNEQNLRKLRDPDRSPLLPAMKSDRDTSPANKFMQIPQHQGATASMPSIPSMPRSADWSPSTQLPATIPQQSFAASRLSVLEPYSGPTGPVNKLR